MPRILTSMQNEKSPGPTNRVERRALGSNLWSLAN